MATCVFRFKKRRRRRGTLSVYIMLINGRCKKIFRTSLTCVFVQTMIFPRLIIYNNCALSADRLVSNQEIFRN